MAALEVGAVVLAAGALHTVVFAGGFGAVVQGADGVNRFYWITEIAVPGAGG